MNLLKINRETESGDIVKNEGLLKACRRAITTSSSRIHLIGMCSNGGVHSHINHILSVVDACQKLGVAECFLHFIADGRDTSPTSGIGFLEQVMDHLKNINYGKLSTVVGRYYAMDRNNNWGRTQVAFDAFCYGKGTSCPCEQLVPRISECYSKGQAFTDEFLTPFVIGDSSYRIKNNDTVIFLNYRSDRMRQIVSALGIKPEFDSKLPSHLQIFCLTEFNPVFTFEMLFPPVIPRMGLSESLSIHKIRQLHAAESEKYAHVTFFFNGGIETTFDLEDRVVVPSPDVKTFHLCPKMSVSEVSQKVVEAIKSNDYPFIIVNLAPPDMVGHSGLYEPTVIACEATDEAIGKIYVECEENNFVLMVTADHGNAEMMFDEEGKPHTAHTTFPVPFIITKGYTLQTPLNRKAALQDIATTVLDVMGVPIPVEMTGVSL
ncbi:hypothetical protein HZS_3741, partial [Henneguya salminicola]